MVKIILLGYMGSGKTSVGRHLAAKTGLRHMDLDEEVEKDTGQPVARIFATRGEIFFRKKEHDILASLLAEKDPFVLSLGGGTPCYANNSTLLTGDGILSVYLQAAPAELAARLEREPAKRPLLFDKTGDALVSFIGQHLFERSFYYLKADAVVATGNKTPEQVAAEILKLT